MGDPQAATSYEVIGKLADGDVAELFLAKAVGTGGDGTMERLVVIKRIPRKATQNLELVKMFLDEAHISARLQHPNIAQVYEVGKLGGSFFFAMEYINGETLRALVEHAKSKKIQVPIRSIVTIAAGAVAALHHAHERTGLDGKPLGIVHADVSPTNLLVSREGIVKLVDFGIAKSRGRSNVATPADKVSYWSPEQCRGETLDRRSDLFSLGVVLWELVTLEDLYHRGGDAKTRAAIENEAAPAASARRYDVPPELDVILQRMIAKDPADRFKDADEVLAALEGLASKLGFQLSTAELARMMRLWFGNVPDPVVSSEKLLVVRSEPVPKDLGVAPMADPIDALLETVRNATDIIRAAAAVLGSTQTPGGADVPKVGDSVESTREDFAQVRDRILAQARTKKETRPPPAAAPTAAEAAAASAGKRTKRETLNASNNAYSFITNVSGQTNEPIRKMGITSTPPMGTAMATASADGAVAAPTGIESGGTPIDAAAASATSPEAATARGDIGKRTATFEAQADVSINDAVALTSTAMAKAGNGADSSPEGNDVAASASAASDASTGAKTDDAAKSDGDAATTAGAAKTDASVDAAKTDAKPDDTAAKADDKATADAATKSDDKAAAKADDKADAKTDDKAAAADDKADDKAAAKTDDKAAAADDKADAKTDDKAAKADDKAAARTDDKAAARTDDKAAARTDDKAAAKADDKAAAKADAKSDDQAAKTEDKGKAKDASREAPPASVRAVRADTPRSSVARGISESDDDVPGGRRPGWILPVALAAGALVVILILFKIKGGDDKPAKNTQQQQQVAMAADAQVVAPPVVADAQVVAVQTPDAQEVAAVPVDAQAVAAVPVDAQVAVAPPVDAAVQVATIRPDAAVKPKDPVDKPKDPVKPKDPPASEKSIEELVAAGDFMKANKACKSNTIFNSVRLTSCTIAACNAKDTTLAKRWIRAIEKSARADLIKTCGALGVTVEDPSAPAPASPPAP